MKFLMKRFLPVFMALMMLIPSAALLDGIGIAQTITVQAATKKGTVKTKKTKVAVPAKLSVKAKASNSLDVSFKKVSKANGYVIYYSTSKKFTKKTTKKVTVKVTKKLAKKKTISKRISRLKNNKNYYVRVKAYKVVKKKKIYSKYSSVKRAKAKKVPKKTTQNNDNSQSKDYTEPTEPAKPTEPEEKPTESNNNQTVPNKTPVDLGIKDNNNGTTVVKDYFPESPASQILSYDEDQETTFSKGEWINLLVKKIGGNPESYESKVGFSYNDISDSPYANAIQMAHDYGIINNYYDTDFDTDNDVPTFYPNAVATREFAAYTAVIAAGFHVSETELYCTDSAQVKYKDQIAIALNNDFIELDNNGRFNPDAAMTGTDRNQIFAKFDKLNESENIDKNTTYESVEFSSSAEGATSSSYTVTKIGTDTYTVKIPATAGDFATGDVVVLPANDEYISGFPIKVQSATMSNGMYTISAVKPQINEVYSKIQYQGVSKPDITNIECEDGVVVSYDPNVSVNSADSYNFKINTGFETSLPGKLEFKLKDKKIVDGVELNGKFEISVPSVQARIDAKVGWGGLTINDFLCSVTEKIKFEGGLEATGLTTEYEITHGSGTIEEKAGAIEIGKIPFPLGSTGLSVELVFYFDVSVKGNIKLTYTINMTEGVQYTNGCLRDLFNINSDLESIEISATAKAGIKASLGFWALSAFNIVSAAGEGGIKLNASYIPHYDRNPTLHCGQLGAYLYLKVGLDEDCLVSTLLHFKWDHDVFDENNSPWRKILHLENGNPTENNICTYGKSGKLKGKVVRQGNGLAISGAGLKIYSGNALIYQAYTDSNGNFESPTLLVGNEYKIIVSATGYKRYESKEKVEAEGINQLETYKMIPTDSEGEGWATGKVTSAATGMGISNASIIVYSGWNTLTGEPVTTITVDSDGTYDAELPVGNYTLCCSANGYSQNNANIAINFDETTNQNIVLNTYDPNLEGTFRVVLTWGEYPDDLDSHWYSNFQNSDYHIYYSDEIYYDDGDRIAYLDVDDTSSYGPETITVYEFSSNENCNYFVHDYTNRYSDNSFSLSNSGATVRVYYGNDLRATFHVPVDQEGTVWHVFSYKSDTDTITPSNDMYYESDPEYVNRK